MSDSAHPAPAASATTGPASTSTAERAAWEPIGHDRPVRAAIIGTGAVAHLHAQAIALDPLAEVVACSDPDAVRLDDFADRYAVLGRYQTLIDLLASEAVDVVHLCTPPGVHREQTLEAAAAGVHVVCEKPPALSLAELDDMQEACDTAGVALATVFQQRTGSGAAHVRDLLRSGALGRPLLAQCETLWYRGADYYAVDWRGRWDTEGGGPTMGHGIHQFDLLLATLGPWTEVTALAGRQARDTDTEDVSMALVRFENGALASIVNSVVSPRQTSQLRFDLERATVDLEHLYGYTDASWSLTPAPGHEELASLWVSDPDSATSSHSSQLAAIVDALDGGQAPPVTATDARLTVELVAALYASAFTGQPVRRGDLGPDHPFATSMEGTGAPWAGQPAAAGAPAATSTLTEETR